jgi:hypothetical protein
MRRANEGSEIARIGNQQDSPPVRGSKVKGKMMMRMLLVLAAIISLTAPSFAQTAAPRLVANR